MSEREREREGGEREWWMSKGERGGEGEGVLYMHGQLMHP